VAKPTRTKSGKWRIQVFLGYDENGKRLYHKQTVETHKEAVQLIAMLQLQRTDGKKKTTTVKQGLQKYIMSVGSFMLMEAALSFLGLGDPTKVTWGGMINLAYKCGGFSKGALNWYLPPGICIAMCVLAFFCVNYYFEKKALQVDGDKRSYLD